MRENRGIFRQWMENAYICRLFYFLLAAMEVTDFVSDILWVLSVTSGDAFDGFTNNEEEMNHDHYRFAFWISIYICTTAFFTLSTTLLYGKCAEDYNLIYAPIPEDRKPFKKLEFFGFNIFYLLTASNADLLALHHARLEDHDQELFHIVDSLVGIHRSDNHLDAPCPVLSKVLAPKLGSKGFHLPHKLWELYCYPIALVFSWKFYEVFPFLLTLLLWPIAMSIALLSMGSILLVGLGNIFSKSKHIYTIRLFEDIPQFTINIVYLLWSPFGRNQVNYFSMFCLIISGMMLLKFIMELTYEIHTTDKDCVLFQRRIHVSKFKLTGKHVFYATLIAPIVAGLLAPGLYLYFMFEGAIQWLGQCCCALCLSRSSTELDELIVDDAEERSLMENLIGGDGPI